MFTGLVQHLGVVADVRDVAFGRTLVVDAGAWSHRSEPGSSIAVNGCCLTVTAGSAASADSSRLRFDVIRQTLDLTTLGDLAIGDPVNLEHAVTPETLLGGHIVQGHVDGVGEIREVRRDETEWRVTVAPPPALCEVIVEKGSVALDGVSLTVAAVRDDAFEVALIPTTLEMTTLGRSDAGRRVNIETDYVAKTIVHWLRRQRTHATPHG